MWRFALILSVASLVFCINKVNADDFHDKDEIDENANGSIEYQCQDRCAKYANRIENVEAHGFSVIGTCHQHRCDTDAANLLGTQTICLYTVPENTDNEVARCCCHNPSLMSPDQPIFPGTGQSESPPYDPSQSPPYGGGGVGGYSYSQGIGGYHPYQWQTSGGSKNNPWGG